MIVFARVNMKGCNKVIDVVGINIKFFEGEINDALNVKEKIDGGFLSILCSNDVISDPDDS